MSGFLSWDKTGWHKKTLLKLVRICFFNRDGPQLSNVQIFVKWENRCDFHPVLKKFSIHFNRSIYVSGTMITTVSSGQTGAGNTTDGKNFIFILIYNICLWITNVIWWFQHLKDKTKENYFLVVSHVGQWRCWRGWRAGQGFVVMQPHVM